MGGCGSNCLAGSVVKDDRVLAAEDSVPPAYLSVNLFCCSIFSDLLEQKNSASSSFSPFDMI